MEENKYSLQCAERIAKILSILGNTSMSLSEISKETEINKASTFRILKTLEEYHFIFFDKLTHKYQLGPEIFRIAFSTYGNLIVSAREEMKELCTITGETITLHILRGSMRICIEEFQSTNELRYTAGTGAITPVHIGAAGKLLLAFLGQKVQEDYLVSLKFLPAKDKNRINLVDFKKELQSIRELGYATSFSERVEGAAAISVPIKDFSGSVIAALSILGPEVRLSKEKLINSFLPELKQKAEKISMKLGYRGIYRQFG